MKNHKISHRIIATFFLLIFVPTFIPTNLFASNNGPKSPEAAGFEPVDATDMVNLLTGQCSYVLPLLNVPSPEGGYPLSLVYHAGIAMDQESSWTGLGWNVNPGAIDRSINGYPDDYNASHLNEYFYDSGGEAYASYISFGYSLGAGSVGLGFNWGSNQSLGGYVSAGVGFDDGVGNSVGVNGTFGTTGASVGVGAQFAGGLTVGANVNTNGEASIRAGFSSNGEGLSVGYNTSGTTTFTMSGKNGMDFSLVSSRKGVTVSGGIGITNTFTNNITNGDYITELYEFNFGLMVPTPYGIFSLGFGKQTFNYYLAKNKDNFITGPLYFQNELMDVYEQVYVHSYHWDPVIWHHYSVHCTWTGPGNGQNPNYCPFDSPHGSGVFHDQITECHGPGTDSYGSPHSVRIDDSYWETVLLGRAFMDITEVPIDNYITPEAVNHFPQSRLDSNNITLPNYDSYNVQAQGMSGSMSSPIFENGALIGLSNNPTSDGYTLKYNLDGNNSLPDNAKFNGKPNFYLDNEISTYVNVQPATFNTTSSTNPNIIGYYGAGSVELAPKSRRKTSTFIEYYTNNEIQNNYITLKQNGYLQPDVTGIDRPAMPKDGIGAFKITAIDGKTYHYSLPVYNMEVITRTSGLVSTERLNESQSYMEKRQLEPFATHWLLTAVTGPDYVDNGDGIAGDGDLGYWTSFEYGKWTDAFIWKAPYSKSHFYDEINPNIKTSLRGRKELYYLDKVKTRTHTALFVKSQRTDSKSINWIYDSVNHVNNNFGSYINRFTVPSQNQMELDKIILIKNEDNVLNKASGPNLMASTDVKYNNSDKPNETAYYNMTNNIIDTTDNWEACIGKAIKVIDFTYDYSLFKGEACLTLKSVDFKGKGGNKVLPPYKFEYQNISGGIPFSDFDRDTDGWGYNVNSAEFSLNKIITPQGASINIEYEKNKFKSITNNSFKFNKDDPNNTFFEPVVNAENKLEFKAKTKYNLGITVGSYVTVYYTKWTNSWSGNYLHTPKAVVTEDLGNNTFKLVSLGPLHPYSNSPSGGNNSFYGAFAINYYHYDGIGSNHYNLVKSSVLDGGGIRASKITIKDGSQNYVTEYKYGQNEDGIGYVSYIPFSKGIHNELSYSSELPPPRVMYDVISVNFKGSTATNLTKIQYKFNTMKPISKINTSGKIIKYDNFYEVDKISNESPINNTSPYATVYLADITIKNNLAAIGQLLEIKTFNYQGQMSSKTTNEYYKNTDPIPNNMGITQEAYQTYKTIDEGINGNKWIINSTKKIKYPSILKSSTSQKDSYSYTTFYNDYDLVTGQSKEQEIISSTGESIKSRVVPAYLKYVEMGSKVDNINNKNMLSQTAAEYSYIFDKPTNDWLVTGVGITTWSNNWTYVDIAGDLTTPTNSNEKVWRKHKTYTWNGVRDSDGIFTNFNKLNDDGFDWTVPIGVGTPTLQNARWKQISEVTKYNHHSMAIEAKDINNNFASTKMGDNDSKIMVSGNAGYNEMFYAGAENITNNFWLEPEVRIQGAQRTTLSENIYHTGEYSVKTNPNEQFGVVMRGLQHRAGKYKLSVWVHKNNVLNARVSIDDVNNTSNDFYGEFNGETYRAGDWVLKTHYFNCTTDETQVFVTSQNNAVYYDDLMLRPVASSITGYVYDQWDQLSYIIGNNGLGTHFTYDKAGRLHETFVEVVDYNDGSSNVLNRNVVNRNVGGFKRVKENKINYKNPL